MQDPVARGGCWCSHRARFGYMGVYVQVRVYADDALCDPGGRAAAAAPHMHLGPL
jgi:hypothetical protein